MRSVWACWAWCCWSAWRRSVNARVTSASEEEATEGAWKMGQVPENEMGASLRGGRRQVPENEMEGGGASWGTGRGDARAWLTC